MDNYIQLADLIEELFPDVTVEGEDDQDTSKGSITIVNSDGKLLDSLAHQDGGYDADSVRGLLIKAGFKLG